MNKEEFRISIDNEIATTIVKRKDLTYEQIAKLFGVGPMRIQQVAKMRGISRKRGAGSFAWRLKRERWESNPNNL